MRNPSFRQAYKEAKELFDAEYKTSRELSSDAMAPVDMAKSVTKVTPAPCEHKTFETLTSCGCCGGPYFGSDNTENQPEGGGSDIRWCVDCGAISWADPAGPWKTPRACP